MSKPDASDDRGSVLIGLARDAIAAELDRAAMAEPHRRPAWLMAPGAVFVTLFRDGALRGCIGTLEAFRPLYEDLCVNARGAAFRDPRFSPLTRDELAGLTIEVSLLSVPQRLDVASEAEAVEHLVPGRDGVVLRYGEHRATFLPQVWEQLPQPESFLGRLKEKAGLAPFFWHRDLELARYQVEKLVEPPLKSPPAKVAGR